MATALKLIAYIPIIIAIIKAAMEAVEVPGFGPEKKKAVLDVVKAVVEGFGLGDVTKILAVAGVIIDILVSLYNLAGKFGKGGESVPT